MFDATLDPDDHAKGLTNDRIDALRYDNQSNDPYEVPGILKTLMPMNVRVLDVGAGTGSITRIVNEDKGNDVLAIEPDQERAKICRSRGIETHAGLLDDRFAEMCGSFDVVVFSDVLEHVVSPAALLAVTRNILSDEGLLLASVPNVAHWTIRWNLLLGRFDYTATGLMDATHLRWFAERNLRALFEQCGFEIVEMRHSAGAWLPEYKKGVFRLIPRRIRRRGIWVLTKLFPRLFGCQHIVKARKVDISA